MASIERHPETDRGFGRDGMSGLVTPQRAVRAREVSRPDEAAQARALAAAEAALDRLDRPGR